MILVSFRDEKFVKPRTFEKRPVSFRVSRCPGVPFHLGDVTLAKNPASGSYVASLKNK